SKHPFLLLRHHWKREPPEWLWERQCHGADELCSVVMSLCKIPTGESCGAADRALLFWKTSYRMCGVLDETDETLGETERRTGCALDTTTAHARRPTLYPEVECR
ncbi:hypothetical protein INR49_000562, partial [Caranx melampygus]